MYGFMRLQGLLPLNPQGFGAAQVSPDQAFNTSISFMTNTNWQWYSGESTMSYLVQMAALAVQNFVSAAAGIAVAIALIRGFARHETDQIGNFWVDLTRATLYVLIPLSIVAALVLCWQGAIQNFHPVHRGEDGRRRHADDRAGAGRVAGSHQAAGHQWRRVLQRQFVTPLRKPDAVHEPDSDLPDLRARRRPDLHLRPHGEGHAAGMGALLGDVGDVPDRCVRRLSGRTGRQSDPGEAGHRERSQRPRNRAATWRARKRASASRHRRCLPPSRPTPAAAPSTACTTATRRSAAWCRCSTCRPTK